MDARQGDLTDEVFLAASLRGVDALYLVIPDVVNAPDPEGDAEALDDSVIAAIEGAGVARAVLQSSAGADRRTGVGFISALGRIERSLDDLVARSGVAVCHPRCGYLFSYLLMGTHEQRG